MMPASSAFDASVVPTIVTGFRMTTFSLYVPGATSSTAPSGAAARPAVSDPYGAVAEPSPPVHALDTWTTAVAPLGAGGYAPGEHVPSPSALLLEHAGTSTTSAASKTRVRRMDRGSPPARREVKRARCAGLARPARGSRLSARSL